MWGTEYVNHGKYYVVYHNGHDTTKVNNTLNWSLRDLFSCLFNEHVNRNFHNWVTVNFLCLFDVNYDILSIVVYNLKEVLNFVIFFF